MGNCALADREKMCAVGCGGKNKVTWNYHWPWSAKLNGEPLPNSPLAQNEPHTHIHTGAGGGGGQSCIISVPMSMSAVSEVSLGRAFRTLVYVSMDSQPHNGSACPQAGTQMTCFATKRPVAARELDYTGNRGCWRSKGLRLTCKRRSAGYIVCKHETSSSLCIINWRNCINFTLL